LTLEFKARRQPVHNGPAAWAEILGPPGPACVLEQEITADFVVIGAGFAGLSAARRLTQLAPDARVAVLEAGRIAEGAAGRNSGFMIDLPHDLSSDDYAGSGDDSAVIARNRQAIAFAAAAVEEYGISSDYFDPAGKINGAVSETADAHNNSYAQHLCSLGEPFERLDAKQMLEITGSEHYRSGLYTPGTVMLQPAGYIRGLARGLSNLVDIYENSPVSAICRKGKDWHVQTKSGDVTAPKVILTTNGHLESFGIEPGRLIQLFLFASITREMDKAALERLGGRSRWGVTPSDPMGTTMRRIDSGQGGNRIVTRTMAVVRPGMTTSAADLARATAVQRRKFDQRYPKMAGFPMEYAWAGHLCLSLNGVAVMREIEDGVFSGCVQNGLGTARGTLTGIGAAELSCGASSEITEHFRAEDRPKRLPPAPFATLGANLVIRWKEWRAADE
jgi:glycine/D-amino acid oxidase-like deaminating enzyme